MIIIEIDGGLVQSVRYVPGREREALVVDRDYEGVEEDEISGDRSGREFIGTLWDAETMSVIEGSWWRKFVDRVYGKEAKS